MNWFTNLYGWQLWGFATGIALLTAGLVLLSTRQGRGRSTQHQRLSKLSPQSKNHNAMEGQPDCSYLQNQGCDFLTNEAGQEVKTTKIKQSQTGELKGCEDREQK
jgi:hypothetical protein